MTFDRPMAAMCTPIQWRPAKCSTDSTSFSWSKESTIKMVFQNIYCSNRPRMLLQELQKPWVWYYIATPGIDLTDFIQCPHTRQGMSISHQGKRKSSTQKCRLVRDMLLFKEGMPLHYHMNSHPPSPSQWWHLSHFPRQSTCKQNKSKVEIINICVLQKLDHWPTRKKKSELFPRI